MLLQESSPSGTSGMCAAFAINPQPQLRLVGGIQASEIMAEGTGCMVGQPKQSEL